MLGVKNMATCLRLCLAFLLGCFLLSGARAIAAPEPSQALYDALVAKAESGDTTIDYAALRLSYTRTDHYEPYPGSAIELMLKAFNAMQAKDCPAAIDSARASLKLNYVDFRVHEILADCLEKTGDTAGRDRELATSAGLVKALLASGVGKSPLTAYKVVTISEEYFILEAYYGAHRGSQSLINGEDGHMYDCLTGTTAKGEEIALYFNIDTIFGAERKMFGLSQ